MSNPQTEFDSPWKDVIERYFEDFIQFFLPQAHREIEWSRGFEFLDTELQQVVRDAELGRRLADKLVKVWRTGGEEAWVLIHVEVQSQEETNFAERMYVYHYRIYDRYKRSVASLAVLGDERSNFRPHQFESKLWECEVEFRFPVVKLIDYQQQWSALEVSSNPFATVVMAHLKAQATRQERQQRLEWKLELTRRLYQKGYGRSDVINLFGFIDWVMSLPDELEQAFQQQLSQYEEDLRMPYITSVERSGIRQGLLKGIELGLELKFGSEGNSLTPEISRILDVNLLEAILEGLKTANTMAELRQIYQHSTEE